MALSIAGTTVLVVTGTTAAKQAILAHTGRVKVNALYWVTPTTAGQLCTLQNGDDENMHSFSCMTDADDMQFVPAKPIIFQDGIYCDDMDSGTLYIHYEY
jgi:hypothetical protein